MIKNANISAKPYVKTANLVTRGWAGRRLDIISPDVKLTLISKQYNWC